MASLEGWGSTIELHPQDACRQYRLHRCLDSGGHGVWRSLVAHPLWERGAVGSNPATPTSPEPSLMTSLDSWATGVLHAREAPDPAVCTEEHCRCEEHHRGTGPHAGPDGD